MEKLPLTSENVLAEKIALIHEEFPEVFSEGKIDFERLKVALGAYADNERERYGLSWAGKSEAIHNIQTPSVGTLLPVPGESVNFNTSENLIIEGDNLEVLKLLQKSYHGKVKMIYIDPPYNTGGEFIYPDNFREGLDDYLRYSGQVDEDGTKLSSNTETDGRFHSKWLNMMYSRLFLAKNLLRDDGLMFVSIDDNEVSNLRCMLNEVFGEENFVDSIIWKKRYGGGAKEKYLVTLHEYVLVYAKNINFLEPIFVPLDQESIDRYYTNRDSNYEKRGPYRTHPLEATRSVGVRKNLIYPIPGPGGIEIWPKRQWWWDRERVFDALQKNELEFVKGRDGEYTVHTKQYLRDEDGQERKTKFFSVIDDVYTQHGTSEMEAIFGDSRIFPFPKPSELIYKLLEVADVSDGDIVLDFFAGSGTTAHAVLRMNKERPGKRRFICVQLPEPLLEDSEAYQMGMRSVADITKERVRRVINGTDQVEPLGGDFKVFKLSDSNFKIWSGNGGANDAENLARQLKLFADNIKPGRETAAILYEIVLKSGLPLSAPYEQTNVYGEEIFSIANGALLICLSENIADQTIQGMVNLNPRNIVCLDAAFHGNDNLKTNTKLLMESHGIEFHTV